MEKLIHLPDYPKIGFITNMILLQREARIYFLDANRDSYELYFPDVWDFRCCVEIAFSMRKFEFNNSQTAFSVFRVVENSEFLKKFTYDTGGVYETIDFEHYIIFEDVDACIELVATKPPELRCLIKHCT
ncbi:MAG: hypothetical protein FWG90_01110 [Oscillospiraceae bacterium]|nr:hypothetical protein [Oscillospiraceae bacterium]